MDSARTIDGSCLRWWAWAPRVVAEALRPLVDPLPGIVWAGPPADPGAVARALAATLRAPRAPDAAPTWLDAAQADAFRLLLHVLRRYGGALCAEPAGSGKTYIALAVAEVIAGNEPAVALVPAPLVPQWRSTAERLGVPVTVWSHTRLSRGRLPPGEPRLVIVDESHHFRNPAIRRYRTLAPWLLGRQTLLLSATPLVNHARDLYHQLHLGIRDDALASDGAPSMRLAFDREAIPPALGRFVIQRLDTGGHPDTHSRLEAVDSGGIALLHRLELLRLSRHPGIGALVRSVMFRAASSSAAALVGTLCRYRHLLLHAREAQASGRVLDRASLRRFTLGADAQLLLWAMLPDGEAEGELWLDDLPLLDAILEEATRIANRPDDKSARLVSLLRNNLSTLVFVGARETIPFLRSQLPDRAVAWCTGGRAGIGRTTLPRDIVLGWFRPGQADRSELPGRPVTLLATDVAAEGLDLQTAGRIVHYDLPWTDVRLAQRNGRAVRRGAAHRTVEVIQFAPGSSFEERLHQQERLAVKAGLPRLQGLGPAGRGRWQWRGALADALAGPVVEGIASVMSEVHGVLAGVALEGDGDRVASAVLWSEEGGEWTQDSAVVSARLMEATRAPAGPPPPGATVRGVLTSLSPHLRSLLRDASVHRIAGAPPDSPVLRLGRRLRALAARAVRQRDAALLGALERALEFCTGGHTAGESMLVDTLSALDDAALIARLPTLPAAAPRPAPLHPRVTGLIVFQRWP